MHTKITTLPVAFARAPASRPIPPRSVCFYCGQTGRRSLGPKATFSPPIRDAVIIERPPPPWWCKTSGDTAQQQQEGVAVGGGGQGGWTLVTIHERSKPPTYLLPLVPRVISFFQPRGITCKSRDEEAATCAGFAGARFVSQRTVAVATTCTEVPCDNNNNSTHER